VAAQTTIMQCCVRAKPLRGRSGGQACGDRERRRDCLDRMPERLDRFERAAVSSALLASGPCRV